MTKLSIFVPVYNEADLVTTVIERLLAVDFGPGVETEVMVVDDGSTDGSAEVVDRLGQRYPRQLRVIRHACNRGKGAAIRTAIEHATGEFAVIQDSDLEYNPSGSSPCPSPAVRGTCRCGIRLSVPGIGRAQGFVLLALPR